MSFSVLILTLNEEAGLPRCIQSIAKCDDIVVLDSYSNDATEGIAREAGARFFQRRFDNFASQRNFALKEIEFKHQWIFHLDADERMTPELIAECNQAAAANELDGYFVPSKMMLMGKWLKHAASYPAYQMRFARRGAVDFMQHGHGQRECAGPEFGYLQNPLIHYSFSKGFTDWWERHNRYSTDEARQQFHSHEPAEPTIGTVFSSDPIARRRGLKQLSKRLPCGPWVKFVYLYLARLGFLDGRAGLTYCALQAIYEYMIVIKLRELQRREKGLEL